MTHRTKRRQAPVVPLPVEPVGPVVPLPVVPLPVEPVLPQVTFARTKA